MSSIDDVVVNMLFAALYCGYCLDEDGHEVRASFASCPFGFGNAIEQVWYRLKEFLYFKITTPVSIANASVCVRSSLRAVFSSQMRVLTSYSLKRRIPSMSQLSSSLLLLENQSLTLLQLQEKSREDFHWQSCSWFFVTKSLAVGTHKEEDKAKKSLVVVSSFVQIFQSTSPWHGGTLFASCHGACDYSAGQTIDSFPFWLALR